MLDYIWIGTVLILLPLGIPSFYIAFKLIQLKFNGTIFNKYFTIILILNGLFAPCILGTRILNLVDNDSDFLVTRCRLDRFFYLPLVGIFLSWAVTSIIFRFIMIKYADRGLVEDGTTRPLFDYLYYLYNFVSSMVGLVIDFGKYLQKGWDAEKEMKYLNRCTKNYDYYHEGNKNLIVSMAFLIMILVPAVIMFIGVKFYLRRRSKGGNMPAKYGPYQRNLVTLSQTVQFFILFIITEVLLAVFLSILESSDTPSDTVRSYMIGIYLIEYFIIEVGLPVYIIFDLTERGYFLSLPGSVERPGDQFFVHPPTLQPRNREAAEEKTKVENRHVLIKKRSESMARVEC